MWGSQGALCAVRCCSLASGVACLEGTCCNTPQVTDNSFPCCQCVKDVCAQYQNVALFSYAHVQGACSDWHVCACWMPALLHHSHPAVAAHVVPAVAASAGLLPLQQVGCLKTSRGSQGVAQICANLVSACMYASRDEVSQ